MQHPPLAGLAAWIDDARGRTLAPVARLAVPARPGPRLATVNPLLWEIGHIGGSAAALAFLASSLASDRRDPRAGSRTSAR